MGFGKAETYLVKAINNETGLWCNDRYEALENISMMVDRIGMYGTALHYGVLNENKSAEDFAIEFMTAFNKEVGHKY